MQELREYLPIQLDIKDKLCIIVGGGKVALRKLKVLLKYKPKILLVAKEIREKEIYSLKESNNNNIEIFTKEVKYKELKKGFLIIIATDDKKLNQDLSSKLVKEGFLVNDATGFGNVDFPASFAVDKITVSVYSGGSSPGKTKNVKDMIFDFLKNKIK